MELQHISHPHSLAFHEEQCHEGEQDTHCIGCGELVSGPTFSCVACGFHLHKSCADAPLLLDHPFHRDHVFFLLTSSPADGGRRFCHFCGKDCDHFMYHCSCNLNLHIKCALFSCKIAEKNVGDVQICHIDPQITFSGNQPQELQEANCFVCRKPLLDSSYISPDLGFYLHEKCVQQPLQITHLSHRHHPLFLQFATAFSFPTCDMCKETQHEGLVYRCWSCTFLLHIKCLSPPPVIEDSSCHEHPFYRCFRQVSFNCDACGTKGKCVSYICLTCSLEVHKNCISLPRFIKSWWHMHPMSHKHFIVDKECRIQRLFDCSNEFGIRKCIYCHDIVDKNYGSYSCSQCRSFMHVECAFKYPNCYEKIESEDEYDKLCQESALDVLEPSFSVIRDTKIRDKMINLEIKHFSHEHNLLFSNEVKIDRYCDGCSLPIVSSFYYCSQSDFCLHQSCAELSRKQKIFSGSAYELLLTQLFKCWFCNWPRSGFACQLEEFGKTYICTWCLKVGMTWTSQGHQHPLLYYHNYKRLLPSRVLIGPSFDEQLCQACGKTVVNNSTVYSCVHCKYIVHFHCALLPLIIRHKCDEHNLALTYQENNDHSESQYCDIREEERDSKHWFYHCTICDTSTHLVCATGDYPFIKPGIRIRKETVHPHSLVFMKNSYQYPTKCQNCHEPCLDSFLECEATGCNYMTHFKCVESSILD